MESAAHGELKAAAVAFLFSEGCVAAAREVLCPLSRYRVDAAGYLDPLPSRPRGWTPAAGSGVLQRVSHPRTVLIECKASRADFLRDAARCGPLLARRLRLDDLRRELEERYVKPLEPHLRRSGGYLFPDLEAWDFASSRVAGYRAVLRELRRVDAALYAQTKFFTVARYCLADYLYLLAPPGMIAPGELPRGWGLLEATPGVRAARVAVAAEPSPATERSRQRTLRNIAVAACRADPSRAEGAPTFTRD